MRKSVLAVFALVLMSVTAMADDTPKMLHMDVRVQEGEGEPMSIVMNFPMSFLHSLIPNINEALDHADLEGQEINIRQLWNDIRDAGPNEYVNIDHADGRVVVSTDDTHVKIDVDGGEEGKINITIALDFLDLMLNGEGEIVPEELLERLGTWEGDIVNISGDKVNGRVWMD